MSNKQPSLSTLNPFAVCGFLIGMSILIGMGYWQLTKGLNKHHIKELTNRSEIDYIPVNSNQDDWSLLNYQFIELTGYWIEGKDIWLNDRIYQSTLGVEVYSPYRLQNDKTIILINRGWIEKGAHYPQTTNALQRLRGQLVIPQKGFTLGETFSERGVWPAVAQYFDQAAFSLAYEDMVANAALILSDESEWALQQIWSPSDMSPERHFAYAFQWFALAITLFVFGVIWHRSTRIKSNELEEL